MCVNRLQPAEFEQILTFGRVRERAAMAMLGLAKAL
jgi:hypothetical protein